MPEARYQVTDPDSVMELRGRLFHAYLHGMETGFTAQSIDTEDGANPRQFTVQVNIIYLESPSAFEVTDVGSGKEINIKLPRHGPVRFTADV